MIILRQTIYARRDYEGLSDRVSKDLRNQRNIIAKELADQRGNSKFIYGQTVDKKLKNRMYEDALDLARKKNKRAVEFARDIDPKYSMFKFKKKVGKLGKFMRAAVL